MTNGINNAFTTIRETFHHIAAMGGPQYAGVVRIRDVEGRLCVSEFNQWLWGTQSTPNSRILSDQELEDLISPLEVLRTLLWAAEDSMIQLFHELDCVQARVRRNRILNQEPGRSEADVVISELFRLRVHSTSHRVM